MTMTSFAQLSNCAVSYHSSSTSVVRNLFRTSVFCCHRSSGWAVCCHMSLGSGEKKNKTRCGSGGSRMRGSAVHFHGAGGGWQHRLKRGYRAARASQLTNLVAHARPTPRQTASLQWPHSRVIKTPRVFNNNGNLRSVQTCWALQNRARKEQVRLFFSVLLGMLRLSFQFHLCSPKGQGLNPGVVSNVL